MFGFYERSLHLSACIKVYCKDMTDEEKIIWAHTRGFPQRVIKEVLHFGSDKVSYVINYYKHNGTVPEKQPIKPTKLTPEVLTIINTQILENAHLTLNNLQDIIKKKLDLSISLSTISIGLKRLKFYYKPPKHTQLLTPKQKSDRVAFAYTMLNMFYSSLIDFNDIIFSDESRFILGDDKRWVWRRRGENNPSIYKKEEKFPPSIMIYGAIGVNYKSKLVFVSGSIDSSKYRENIIESEMIETLNETKGKGNWIFMQDGAKPHSACDTISWLEKQCRYISKWPSNSPDLNPIETLWGLMKRTVSHIQPQNLNELKCILQQVWDNIKQETINNLVKSFFQRLQLIIANNGESIQPYLRHDLSQNHLVVHPIGEVSEFDVIISGLSTNNGFVEHLYNKDSFSKEEDAIILQNAIKNNRRWDLIAKRCNNRSKDQLKARYNELIKNASFHISFD